MNTLTMNTLMTPITRLGLIFAGLLVAGLCQATPIHPFQGSDAFGKPGDQVTVSLLDEAIADLDSATIKVTYDPLFLMFTNATAGDLAADGFFVTLAGNPYDDGPLKAIDVSVAGSFILSGGPSSILAIQFGILPGASIGVTPVSFDALPINGEIDYDVPKTTGHVHVTAQDVAVPEPETMLLLLVGLLLMRYRLFGEEDIMTH